jgi:hypothetical protein
VGRDQMMIDDILKILVPVLIAIFGWVVVHWFSMGRDRSNKIRDLKTKYLIEAFQKISLNVYDDSDKSKIESALVDIQLFGQPEEVELAHKFMYTIANGEGATPNELIHLLRANLRKELKLPPLRSGIPFFRFTVTKTEI